ncbi:phenylacetic acid degradation-related protein [Bacillus sp. OxB-1]|uniref:PaaI family thioesterase n=1 Tax=Bacillus sp. (strain OxB-1) TaxID=98228 RepID=UPI000581BCA9|nr:PaaI family thioesterase [Bacillus sp. OxB-1]BAQ10667.1 phenylacetic acid degradation-related protein [Bacillus sp. OxB-1]
MVELKKVDLMEVVREGATPPNCDLTLQIETTYAEEGVSRGVWTVDEKFINGNGVSMGGYLASAADIMMAYAVVSKLQPHQTFASIDLHTTFHRPVFPGQVDVEARVERLGRTVAYVVAELSQNGKKVGDVVSSVMILEK